MNAHQAAAHRRVIDAARQVERAVQYGVDAATAHRQYDRSRDVLARVAGTGRS
jgi:hypothetical protein